MHSNLKPITSKAQARELGRKGGMVSSSKKRYAARLRELKKKGMTNEAITWLTDIMEDPGCSALNLLLYLYQIEHECKTVNEKIYLLNTFIKWHKMHHGTRIKTESVSKEIDWDKTLESCTVKET